MCWKCPPRSAMHAFTLFLMFDATRWIVSAVKCTAQYFVSVLLMCAGCFCIRSPSKTPKDGNLVAIDPGSRGRPQVSRNKATTKELAQHLRCLICCMRLSPILLKPAVLFVNFQKGNEIHNQFLVTFGCYRFTEETGISYPPSRDSTPYSDF
jgi:hypothetical protein